MTFNFDMITRIIELIFGISSAIFLFIIMVYRLSYRLSDLSERFKEQNDFIRDFKKNFEDFKLSTSEQLAQIKMAVASIEKNVRNDK